MNDTLSLGRVFACLLAVGLPLPPAVGAAPEAGKTPYTLFMGADVALEQGKGFYRVEGVVGSYFRIRVDGKEVLVSTEKGTSRMRIDSGLKLGGPAAVIDGLETERAYTLARDPNRRFNNMSSMGNTASVAADLAGPAVDNAALALRTASVDTGGHGGEGQAQAIANAQTSYDSAVQSRLDALGSMGSDINSAGSRANELQVELAKENYDAINISMSVSSPVPLDDPYVLVVARIHERDEKPGVFRNWIYAQRIDPIGIKPRSIHINHGGLPIGYSLEECQVRIYNHGREVPTSESPKRVGLTREQAQQYVVIEHLAANKDATMPALPVLCQAPADLKGRIAAGEYSEPCFVKIDADGNPAGTFADRECTRTIDDPYVQAIVSNALFTPALEKGRPVNGVARLQLVALLN